jgi:acylphosphatase
MAVRKRVVVSGRVQGVWFRGTTEQRAREFGVAGWAKNCSDGSVEVVAEGEPEAVDRLVEFLREGPRRAEVAAVDVADEEPEGLSGFETR